MYSIWNSREWVFNNCSSLNSVTIPDGVTSIGEGAFLGCSNLSDIRIPKSVTAIGSGAFDGTEWLENQRILNPLVVVNGVLIDGKTASGHVVIPDNVISIGDNAFGEWGSGALCSSLSSISIPDSVRSIGEEAFIACSDLNDVEIPNSVTRIGRNAFHSTKWLANQYVLNPLVVVNGILIGKSIRCASEDIEIPDGVTSIGDGVFFGYDNLRSVSIPDGVKIIGKSAFGRCSSLSSITIPDSVISIEESAFGECSSLSSIAIPDSVINIGKDAFYGCSNLSDIRIPKSVTAIGSGAFDDTEWLTKQQELSPLVVVNKILIDGTAASGNVVIPNDVKIIGGSAFSGCDNLRSLEIPNSVISIEEEAFAGCSSLNHIVIPEGIRIIEKYAFSGCSSLSRVTIPKSVTIIRHGAFGSSEFDAGLSIYYNGEKAEWEKISIGSYNYRLTNGEIHYNFFGDSGSSGYQNQNTTNPANQKPGKVSIILNGQEVKGILKTKVKKSYFFKAVVSSGNINPQSAVVTWVSGNPSVATANSEGKVTIKKAGIAKITATTADGIQTDITLKASNKAVKVTKLKITGRRIMAVKETQILKLSIMPATADNRKVKWKSSNKIIASINGKGKITAKKKGTVKIAATAKDGSRKKAVFKIKIK